ncbi:hypothetical protein BGZ61DRAFT_466670 [Ilyonectria robusta]|uniref:uncharacterized protein n=1 Tax=Ilyonectria robusta TaxID=1079257 RepID=UPI001E8EA8CC|nr:uncharacterized protein BGZ61DRAFT_466670 [Ilyonectria robusta]KAH8656359.1 hypothetical protein BGZ61DRAFT_466670 [Ilyonectria robusta]
MFRDDTRSRAAASAPGISAGPLPGSKVASPASRGPPKPKGSSVGNVFTKNGASNESANSSPRRTWMYGSEPSAYPRRLSPDDLTHVLGPIRPSSSFSPTASQANRNFSASATSGGPSSANIPDEVTSLIGFTVWSGSASLSAGDSYALFSPAVPVSHLGEFSP